MSGDSKGGLVWLNGECLDRCGVCDGSRFVGSHGPYPARVMLIGEKPGRDEDRKGIPFVGRTGKELDVTYLGKQAGLDRGEIYVTNTLKCRLGGNNNKPTPKQVGVCAGEFIAREIELVRPEVIVLLGSTACSLVGGIELERDHGMPLWVDEVEGLPGYTGWVWVSYHPAAGMHNTQLMTPLLQDFKRLGEFLRGEWDMQRDEHPKTEYVELESQAQIIMALSIIGPYRSIGYLPTDTEDDLGRPWSIQFSPKPGVGFLIKPGMAKVWWRMVKQAGYMGLAVHNAEHELLTFDEMGIDLRGKLLDTMRLSYHLRDLPQGLKPLASRLCGMSMRSWEDLVRPATLKKLEGWIEDRIPIAAKENAKLLKRVLRHLYSPTYDPWERLDPVYADVPRMSISHVERSEAVEYACRDADATGRVLLKMVERMDRLDGEWLHKSLIW